MTPGNLKELHKLHSRTWLLAFCLGSPAIFCPPSITYNPSLKGKTAVLSFVILRGDGTVIESLIHVMHALCPGAASPVSRLKPRIKHCVFVYHCEALKALSVVWQGTELPVAAEGSRRHGCQGKQLSFLLLPFHAPSSHSILLHQQTEQRTHESVTYCILTGF